jgi:hypothetical protein
MVLLLCGVNKNNSDVGYFFNRYAATLNLLLLSLLTTAGLSVTWHTCYRCGQREFYSVAGKDIDPLFGLTDNEGENSYLSAEMAGNI